MLDIKKYKVSYLVYFCNGKRVTDSITFACFSCLSALARFEEWFLCDVDGRFTDVVYNEVLSVIKE